MITEYFYKRFFYKQVQSGSSFVLFAVNRSLIRSRQKAFAINIEENNCIHLKLPGVNGNMSQ